MLYLFFRIFQWNRLMTGFCLLTPSSTVACIRNVGTFQLSSDFMHHLDFLSSFPYSSRPSLIWSHCWLTWKMDSSTTNSIKWRKNLNLNYETINYKNFQVTFIPKAVTIILNLCMPQKLIAIKKNREDVYRCISMEPCHICLPTPPPSTPATPGQRRSSDLALWPSSATLGKLLTSQPSDSSSVKWR